MYDFWYLHRRGILVCAGLVAAMALAIVGAAFAAHSTSPGRAAQPPVATGPRLPATHASTRPASPASDVDSWDAMPPIKPTISAALPAITGAATRDPNAFVAAFAKELFTRDYSATTRDELISWAQYEDAALKSPNYPSADWTKVLVDSLTDLTWDIATDTPIPSVGMWLALRSQQATDTVSAVKVTLDATWEAAVAGGHKPGDPLATARDVSLTITRHTKVSGRAIVTRFSVSLAVQLGTSSRGDYGVAATDNYVSDQVS